jgi:DNA transposition AAA+ family ATPase
MKNEIKDQIIDALNAFLEEHKMSANDIARKTEVNAAYISQMRKKQYSTNVSGKDVEFAPKYFEKIAEFIGFKYEKSYWNTVATEQFKHVISVLEDARQFGLTNLIIGETGSGKTYSAQIFAQQHPHDTWIITVGSTDNIGDLIDKVCDAIRIPPRKTKSKKLNDIIRALRAIKQAGNKPMLIFDESEYMKMPALCAMKELYDGLNGVASIMLIGTDQLIRNIEKLRKKNRDGIPQLYRRIKFGIRVLPAIDKSFKQFLNGFDGSLSRFLKVNCENYGELHDVLVPAMREADRSGQPMTENFVRTVLNMPQSN